MRNRYLLHVKDFQLGNLLARPSIWLSFCLFVLLSYQSCTDAGVLVAIEDAKSLRDGNLSNYIFVHSMAQIGRTVYAGSKLVWQKTASDKDWSKVSLPSSINTDDTPIVSIAEYSGQLFVASSKIVYVRNSGGAWIQPLNGNFSFYSLRNAGTEVLAIDTSNTIFRYVPAADWVPVLRNTPINAFAFIAPNYYAASGKKLIMGSTVGSTFTTAMPNTPNGNNTITDLLAVNYSSKDYIYMLADGKLFVYDVGASTWASKGDNSARNISMLQVGAKLLIGRFQAGYQIYDLASDSWAGSFATDGFTDTSSLVTLPSGSSISNLSFGSLLFYDDSSDSKDRIYAATESSNGLFSAKRNGSLWSWGWE